MTGHKPHLREISRYYTVDEQTQKDSLKKLVVTTVFSKIANEEMSMFSELNREI